MAPCSPSCMALCWAAVHVVGTVDCRLCPLQRPWPRRRVCACAVLGARYTVCTNYRLWPVWPLQPNLAVSQLKQCLLRCRMMRGYYAMSTPLHVFLHAIAIYGVRSGGAISSVPTTELDLQETPLQALDLTFEPGLQFAILDVHAFILKDMFLIPVSHPYARSALSCGSC